jgi:hypothetical protein
MDEGGKGREGQRHRDRQRGRERERVCVIVYFISTSFSIPKEPNSYSAISTRGQGKGDEDDGEEGFALVIGREEAASSSETGRTVWRKVSMKSKV